MSGSNTPSAAQNMMAQNMAARAAIVGNCPTVIQKIASITNSTASYTSGQATTVNVPLQNVGLIKRMWVRITGNVSQGAAETQNLTTFGPANFLSQVVLTDLNNLVRINTAGWHLNMVSSARRQFPFAAAITSDNPTGFGSNFPIIKAPAAVTATQPFYMCYEIPLAYADTDLRGAIFANVVNATMNLQLTINPNLFVTNAADATLAMYKSTTAQLGLLNSYKIDVYQEYYDQLPRDQTGGYQLPMIDLANVYTLINTSNTGLAVGTDQSLPYANFRSYLSTCLVYDNGGTLNPGTDINYFSLATANAMNLFKYDHRAKPLSTLTFGNMQLNVNPSVVNANAILLLGYEYMALQNQLQTAGSIASS
jgi:hypothetical protein